MYRLKRFLFRTSKISGERGRGQQNPPFLQREIESLSRLGIGQKKSAD
jgi:hypothetical protein